MAPIELAKNMELMGFTATAERVAENLIRLVDDDQSGLLTWRKCRSLFMFATALRSPKERRRDLEAFFSRIQKKTPRQATVFEITKALPLQSTAEDLATLMWPEVKGRHRIRSRIYYELLRVCFMFSGHRH